MNKPRHALLVHGAGGGAWEWNLWRGVWQAQGIETDALDLQPVPAGLAATVLRDYLVQVRAALRVLPRPRALVGASLGGLLASLTSDDADALVLVNPLPPAPWHAQLPVREWPEVVRWQGDARLASTHRAMADADDASALFAFRHWRDESGAALREARAGVAVRKPDCPVLLVASAQDDDVPPAVVAAMADAWGASRLQTSSTGHVGPLLGRHAAAIAGQAAAWLDELSLG